MLVIKLRAHLVPEGQFFLSNGAFLDKDNESVFILYKLTYLEYASFEFHRVSCTIILSSINSIKY